MKFFITIFTFLMTIQSSFCANNFGDPKIDLIKLDSNRDNYIADIKYATNDNFMSKKIYTTDFLYMHKDVYPKLKLAIKIAAKLGYKIKIFDAWRPYEGQIELWNHTPNRQYVSNPDTGPCGHCRGGAIDLTLVGKDGRDLDMGSEFDSFDKKSHHDTELLTELQQSNRVLLSGIMSCAGFSSIKSEWWHFQVSNLYKYPKYRAKDLDLKLIE